MTKSLRECRVTVVGLGLMGASLCMDLSHNGLCREVRGVARRMRVVLDAFFSGAVDLATNDLHTGVLGADLVILATPVWSIVDMLEELGPYLWPGAVIMDMGSTKAEICAAMDKLPAGIQPVGGHPMTGKETSGFGAAELGLYVDATWVLSPLERTDPGALALAEELALAVGARPVIIEPRRHDRLVAGISHLPYLVASALVDAVAAVGAEDPLVWELAAGGFRDTSRVAASDTQMFLDILSTNRAAVLEQVDRFAAELGEIRALLGEANESGLREKLERSKTVREEWARR
jgi:prephenate dehydrogenase